MAKYGIKLYKRIMRYKFLIILALTALCLVGCENGKKNAPESNDEDSTVVYDTIVVDTMEDEDSTVVNDTLIADTAEYEGGSDKSLNDIRFENFDENDWLDNEYIRCLRRYLDDYNSGKIENEDLDPHKEKIKGKFVIGWAGPSLVGGMFIQFIFVDYPDDIFLAWVYSFVDEEAETVCGYEVRSLQLSDEKSGFTKEEIFENMKAHPEFKLW